MAVDRATQVGKGVDRVECNVVCFELRFVGCISSSGLRRRNRTMVCTVMLDRFIDSRRD